jgi:hypothetical protein
MKIVSVLFVMNLLFSAASVAQQTSAFFDVVAGNGNGVRFWQDNAYKIHMGNSAEYLYGPVTDYSIKTNMTNSAGRGWTWGVAGQTPVAALNNVGDMQIAGKFTALGTANITSLLRVGPGVDVGTSATGITWYGDSPTAYSIFRTPGVWTAPDYQQLQLTFATGIILAPGTNYGKSYVDIQGGGLRVSSGNVGIGTTIPQGKLHVAGGDVILQNQTSGYPVLWLKDVGGGNTLRLDYNSLIGSGGNLVVRSGSTKAIVLNDAGGNVGIGEVNPTLGRLQLNQSSDASDKGIAILNSTGVRGMRLWTDPANSYVYSGVTGQANLILNGTGNVGIGTSNPTQKLTVNGIIYGKEVKVNLSVPGPDYVFENDYNLPSLKEIKNYVDQHKHLPEVPSAKEMEANGIQLGEMNMLLLKKVEELTLYLIDLKKENEEMRKDYSRKIKALEESIRTTPVKD